MYISLQLEYKIRQLKIISIFLPPVPAEPNKLRQCSEIYVADWNQQLQKLASIVQEYVGEEEKNMIKYEGRQHSPLLTSQIPCPCLPIRFHELGSNRELICGRYENANNVSTDQFISVSGRLSPKICCRTSISMLYFSQFFGYLSIGNVNIN